LQDRPDNEMALKVELRFLFYAHFLNEQVVSVSRRFKSTAADGTIDTFSEYQLKGKRLAGSKNKSFFTQAKPPRFVNYACCAYNGILYVNSRIKADNETENDFDKNSVIDLYAIQNGSYKGSFYVPKPEQKKIQSFVVTDSLIIATYTSAIISYHYFPN
jgi:hypothetical protein